MIDFSNPAMLVNRGSPIPIDTPAEYDAVMTAGSQIYSARPGGSFDSDAQADAEHRILDGQDLNTIVANMYDDALRRFPATQAADTISRDAQLNAGRQYSPTAAETQQIITSAGISAVTAAAAAIPSRTLAEIINPGRQLSTQTIRPAMAGPSQAGVFSLGSGGTFGASGGGLNLGTILMIGGGALVVFLLLKGHKKGRH
jgi:hypothetical protein